MNNPEKRGNYTSGIFLLLGSNLGDRLNHLRKACLLVNLQIGRIIQYSDVYETAPWGKPNQPNFYNLCIEVESIFSPQGLLTEIKNVEKKLGRVPSEIWTERIIDIDILIYLDQIIEEENLIIPHKMLSDRRFALLPLNQIAPLVIHPLNSTSIFQLLKECKDELEVKSIGRFTKPLF